MNKEILLEGNKDFIKERIFLEKLEKILLFRVNEDNQYNDEEKIKQLSDVKMCIDEVYSALIDNIDLKNLQTMLYETNKKFDKAFTKLGQKSFIIEQVLDLLSESPLDEQQEKKFCKVFLNKFKMSNILAVLYKKNYKEETSKKNSEFATHIFKNVLENKVWDRVNSAKNEGAHISSICESIEDFANSNPQFINPEHVKNSLLIYLKNNQEVFQNEDFINDSMLPARSIELSIIDKIKKIYQGKDWSLFAEQLPSLPQKQERIRDLFEEEKNYPITTIKLSNDGIYDHFYKIVDNQYLNEIVNAIITLLADIKLVNIEEIIVLKDKRMLFKSTNETPLPELKLKKFIYDLIENFQEFSLEELKQTDHKELRDKTAQVIWLSLILKDNENKQPLKKEIRKAKV